MGSFHSNATIILAATGLLFLQSSWLSVSALDARHFAKPTVWLFVSFASLNAELAALHTNLINESPVFLPVFF